MSEIKWIKIATDIFDNEKIQLIESMPNPSDKLIIWFKLLCLAGKQNNNGAFVMPNGKPYTLKMLSIILRYDEEQVKDALEAFEEFNMIEFVNGIYVISNWEKHQNIDGMEKIKEQTRKRVAKHRKKIQDFNVSECNVTSNADVTLRNATEKDKEKDKEYTIPPISPKGESLEKSFDEFWKAYPKKVSKTSAIKAWNKLKPDDDLVRGILSALEQLKATEQWQKEDGRFIPYPTTWLNNRRWEDEELTKNEHSTGTVTETCTADREKLNFGVEL